MKAPTKKTNPGDVFFNALKALNRPDLMAQLDSAIQTIASSTVKTGQKSKLTLTITASKCGEERQVMISTECKVNAPAEAIMPRLMYTDDDGNISVDDPAQGELDLGPTKIKLDFSDNDKGYNTTPKAANN